MADLVRALDLMSTEELLNRCQSLNGSIALWQARTDGFPETGESYDRLTAMLTETRSALLGRLNAQTAELEALRKAVRDLVDAANEMLYHRTCSWREDCNTDAGTRLVAARDGVAALLAATRESPAKKEKLCWCGCPYLNCGGRCGQE